MKRATLLLLVMGLLATTAFADEPAYSIPDPKQIARTLALLRDRLDARLVLRLTDPATKQVIADPPAAVTQPAGDGKFSAIGYPVGLVYAGLLTAADATGDKAYSDVVARRFQVMADQLATFSDPKLILIENPLHHLVSPHSLDDCGAMGAAFIKARRAGVGGDLKTAIDVAADFVSHKQFRLEDGTLARNRPFKDSIWADDMYMSVPLLTQMGAMTGQPSYFDDAVRQVLQISSRLFVPSMGLYTHATNVKQVDDQPRYYWGRANGWCALAMAELLKELPENHPQRAQVLKLFRAQMKGVATAQSGDGLWHQMLDRTDSPLETSCSAMFTCALATGVNRGWLDAGTYGPVAIAGWNGLATRVDSTGHLSGVCVGTSYGADYPYYYHRPMKDDIHGYGPTLMAGAEMIRFLNNPHLHVDWGGSNVLMVNGVQAK